MKLLKLVGREEEKKLSFETAEKEAQESAAKRSQAARLLRQQSRIQSLLKQANTYIGIRNLVNGINLLQAAVHQFREVYPNGASPELPNSIAAHNDIVQCIEWVQRLADDDKNYGTPKLELKDMVERLVPSAVEALIEIRPLAVGTHTGGLSQPHKPSGGTPRVTPRGVGSSGGAASSMNNSLGTNNVVQHTPRFEFNGFSSEEVAAARPEQSLAEYVMGSYEER